jgi:hypothetical protein
MTHTRYLPGITGLPSSKDSVANRFTGLFSTMRAGENDHVRLIATFGRTSADSIIGTNLRLLSREYSVDIDKLCGAKLKSNSSSNAELCTIQAIKDIIYGKLDGFLSKELRTQVLNELCADIH